MRIVVSDSSCLIDLRKIELLPAFLQLPYEIVIPDVLFDDELVKFTDEQKAQLLAGGMKIVELPGDGVTRVIELNQANPRLSVHDCFAYVLAERTPDSDGGGAHRAAGRRGPVGVFQAHGRPHRQAGPCAEQPVAQAGERAQAAAEQAPGELGVRRAAGAHHR